MSHVYIPVMLVARLGPGQRRTSVANLTGLLRRCVKRCIEAHPEEREYLESFGLYDVEMISQGIKTRRKRDE